MDWRTVQFDWNRARAFLVTAEEGSLSAAARALGMAQPTLGRQVDALETELGVTLFERVGRRLVLTEAGERLLDQARVMGEAASRMSLAASGQSQVLAGRVCVTATEAFSVWVLPDIVAGLHAEHPGIQIELEASSERRDLLRREADIAIRNVRPEHPDLIAKKIGDMSGHLYAASTYLERLGRPQQLAQLGEAEFVTLGRPEQMIAFLGQLGLELTAANVPFITESHIVSWELVRRGLGIGVMMEAVGARDPTVERAAPQMQPIPFPVWLVTHRELHTSRRVRVVFDRLAEALAELTD
ncbi:LysR family transcriptional regulator [Pseudenhygromyxa sp. WMMC2535]|uniref:LysR family transcriptional regulator n=1 Tax=Pseudenhygromyxa sp. WMMC2535 TaxID=2712867 RepID=UPI001552BE5E|nr:LysR family transcriptional regulator [Pseudenhygromyxa sp. WMMC2535]NVB38834.1 LysR family transcriptional regulator [Pseudenhygromyxa sp. WMMC2535]